MSVSLTGAPRAPGAPRVRHQARQALGLMAFSASVSVGLSLVLVLLMMLGHQG